MRLCLVSSRIALLLYVLMHCQISFVPLQSGGVKAVVVHAVCWLVHAVALNTCSAACVLAHLHVLLRMGSFLGGAGMKLPVISSSMAGKHNVGKVKGFSCRSKPSGWTRTCVDLLQFVLHCSTVLGACVRSW